MKNLLFAALVILAVLILPGCCCTPAVCMPTMFCPNPYWMEDLQDGYCEMAGTMNANLCRLKHSAMCNMCQIKSQLTCSCRNDQVRYTTQVHSRQTPAPQPRPQMVRSRGPVSCATDSQSCSREKPTACVAPGDKCNERCSHCKQQPCRCGRCNGGDSLEGDAQNPRFLGPQSHDEGTNLSPNGPADGIHPSAPARPQEPIQAPPAPKDPPAGPTREGSPTPIPVPIPKISPSASVNGAVPGASPAATPPVDPSIPLERQLNLNHVGFRKADPKRELYNGWKPVAELPKSLR